MIARLQGRLISKTPDSALIDVSGIGYEVFIPLSTYSALPEDGLDVTLKTCTFIKDDSIHLYGFLTDREREFFNLLRSVSGVGPRLARNILSGASAGELAAYIASGDASSLKALPGVGKKTAERIMLELKDKVSSIGVAEAARGRSQDVLSSNTLFNDISSALKNLGYRASEADDAARSVMQQSGASSGGELSFDELFKKAIRALSRK